MPTPKTVLITGCSEGGIGDALAQEFHARGHRVFATARSLSKIDHLTKLGIETSILDVSSEDSIKSSVEEISKLTGGKLDILVNNSGAGYQSPILDGDLNAVKKMFNVNVFGLMAVTNAFSPLIIASKGTIVNIGSIAGIAPLPWQGYYNATKAAVDSYTTNLRLEMVPFGVNVILIVSGVVKTNFFVNQDGTKLKEGSPYSAGKEEIEWAMKGDAMRAQGVSIESFAKAVVSNSLKSNPTKRQWVGGLTFKTWLAYAFGWDTIWDLWFVVPREVKMGTIIRKMHAANTAA